MDLHRGDDAGVGHLNSGHSVINDHLPPCLVDERAVWKNGQPAFYQPGERVCIINGKSESVTVDRASADVPEFCEV
jgi:hypothetical protein